MAAVQLTNAQIQAAHQRFDDERADGVYAVAAYCDQGQLVITLANGQTHRIAIAKLEQLSSASEADVAAVEIEPSGLGLYWESLDWDLSVRHLTQWRVR